MLGQKVGNHTPRCLILVVTGFCFCCICCCCLCCYCCCRCCCCRCCCRCRNDLTCTNIVRTRNRSQMSDFKSRVEVSTASYVSSGLLLNVNAMRQGPTGSGLARRVPVALDTRLCMFSKHQEIFSFYKLQLALRCLQQVMP